MNRKLLLASFVLSACSLPDRHSSEPAAVVARASSPLEIVKRNSAFDAVGRGPVFVADGAVFRAKIDRALTGTAPGVASGPQRLVTNEVKDFEVQLTPLEMTAVRGRSEGSSIVYEGAATDTDMIVSTTPTAFEEVRVLRSAKAPSELRWKVTHTSAVSVRVREGRVEAVDATGYVRIGSAPLFALDARGERLPMSVALEGDVLVAKVDVSQAAYPVVVDPAWSTVPSMARARNIPGYAAQSDGKIWVVGGGDASGNVTFTEEYDPATNSWNSAINVPGAKTGNVAVALPTSIVVPGLGSEGKNVTHFFTSSKDVLLSTPASTVNHDGGPAVAISTTQVLTLGAGFGGSTAEIYQWSGGASWIAAGTTPRSRRGNVLTMLPDGRAMTLGGEVDTSGTIWPTFATTTTTLIFTPSTKTWSAGPNLNLVRSDPVVTKLASGALLITGGINEDTNMRVSVAELYDPTTKTFKTTGAMATARSYHTATLLPNGKVLVAGGYGNGTAGALNTAELYDPATGTFSSAGTLSGRRAGHGAIALSMGRVLLFGGHNSSVALSSAEIFQQANLAAACTAGYECSSGNCVDAHCCSTSSCAMDSTCATGTCAKKGATACAMPSECSSGFCVDGFCCDTACDGQCEACNNGGKEGVCSPTSGAPKGSRPACTGAIVGGECGSQCDGVDATKCNFPTATKSCGSRGCLDGVENTVGVCDGSGRCSASPRTCAGYACQGDTCGTSCETDAQCLSTHKCQDGKCASRGATCSPDNTSVIEGDGKITPCGLFTCKGGVCQSTCAASTDCAGGAICDGTGKCVQPPSVASDEGGCSVGHGSGGAWFAFLVGAAIFTARSRRTPRRRTPGGTVSIAGSSATSHTA